MDDRTKICLSIGIGSIAKAHEIIVQCAKQDVSHLIAKGLVSYRLEKLGYSAEAMKKLGYSDAALAALGFIKESKIIFDNIKKPHPKPLHNPNPANTMKPAPQSADKISPHPPQPPENPNAPEASKKSIRELIAEGYAANQLKQLGIVPHHCRVEGLSVGELYRIGFLLDELANEYPLADLKRIGFSAKELSRYCNGQQLRNLGFTAQDMRCSGYTVRDLINFGYNENQIIGAGFSINELVREGLSVRTVDRSKFQ